jgi:catechol 2,3-dioxygenase-like lactoylglutathione lyase family enzyme
MMPLYAIDHIQLAMPPRQEERARAFYGLVLGLSEQSRPGDLAKRGGVWFECGSLRVHLGVEQDFRPAQKAHPAFLVEGLPEIVERCKREGYKVVTDEPLAGYDRAYVYDPFGNRIELMEPKASPR